MCVYVCEFVSVCICVSLCVSLCVSVRRSAVVCVSVYVLSVCAEYVC